eukprot:GHVR01053757.1.p1 GENE.GHVR01053757.1~~GHVR01053757.1.p1  ORF type:complete len:443 (-),score=93.84 GHVR01053757.1:262-1590(-)
MDNNNIISSLEEYVKPYAEIYTPDAALLPPILEVDLHSYQKEGLIWLASRWLEGMSCILADAMGLGKTLQVIALMNWACVHLRKRGPFLVICPLSVVSHWRDQLDKFWPSCVHIVYMGSAEERQSTRGAIVNFICTQSKDKQRDPLLPFHVLITTYEYANIDSTFLSKFRWRATFIDEAQRLKNFSSSLYYTLKNNYQLGFIVLLTGTPVQNNLTELFSLLHFINSKGFPSVDGFLNIFTHTWNNRKDALNDNSPLLGLVLNKLMLRRDTHTVNLNLPDLIEYVIMVPMTSMQREWYRMLLTRDPNIFSTSTGVRVRGLSNILKQLQKCSCHPYLFEGAESEPFIEGDHIWHNSGKMILLHKLLIKLKSEQSKVLLFSTSTRVLDVVQDYLVYSDYSYERLDGSVRADERELAISRFKNEHRHTHTDTHTQWNKNHTHHTHT